MRDNLLDIMKHTVPLAAFVTLRVDGTDAQTEVSATEAEQQMVLRAKTLLPVAEFKGTFGIPNISLLSTILSIPEYTTDKATFTVVTQERESGVQPTTIHLENETGDFVNDFRLMGANIIENVEPKPKFNVKNWLVDFTPSLASIQRLKYQAAAHPEEKAVTFKISEGNVSATIGDASSHSGNFTFHSGVDSKVKKTVQVPFKYVNAVLALGGDKTIYMGDLGIMIRVNSGIAEYDYILPMLTK